MKVKRTLIFTPAVLPEVFSKRPRCHVSGERAFGLISALDPHHHHLFFAMSNKCGDFGAATKINLKRGFFSKQQNPKKVAHTTIHTKVKKKNGSELVKSAIDAIKMALFLA